MRILASLVALTLASAMAGGKAWAQSPQPPVFAAATQAIYIDITLEPRSTRARRLVASDFRLFDNGVPQAFELVPVEELPVRAVLVFDTSGSMQGSKMAQLSQAALDFVSRLGPRDEVSLLTFSTGLDWVPATHPDSSLRSTLGKLRAEGATSLLDALYSALTLQGVGSRTLVLLFSDGADTTSWLTGSKIRLIVGRSNALIHTVAIPDPEPGPEATAQLRSLREVSESTGGSLIVVETPRQIGEAFTSILDEVRARYVLRYDPVTTPTPGWHKLDVRLASGKTERLRTRSGYWAASR